MKDTLFYLKSILRQLQDLARATREFHTVANEALSDNIDWLDCYIDQLERESAAKVQE